MTNRSFAFVIAAVMLLAIGWPTVRKVSRLAAIDPPEMRAHAAGVGLEQVEVFVPGRRKRVVHRIPGSRRRVFADQRKVGDPAKPEGAILRQVEFIGEPRSEPYGRVVVFRDISGNRWDLLGPPG